MQRHSNAKRVKGAQGSNKSEAWYVELDDGSKFELADKLCYLGDMLCAGGGAEEASRTRVGSAWGKFNELAPVLTRGVSLRLKGKIYDASVQRVLVYGSKTWAMKAEDLARLGRAERMMVQRMCGVQGWFFVGKK